MREIFRPTACALSAVCLVFALSTISSGEVLAQAKQAPPKQSAPAQAAPPPAAEAPAVKQMALTEKQIQGVLAAQKDVDAITDKLPDNAKPDPKVDAQLDAVAKKNGFASYDEYNNVIDNIGIDRRSFLIDTVSDAQRAPLCAESANAGTPPNGTSRRTQTRLPRNTLAP